MSINTDEALDIFHDESSNQLEEYRDVLLKLYNIAEQHILSGNGDDNDYTTLSDTERILHRIQNVLDRRMA